MLKRLKQETGSLTIEASVSLTLFVFFMLFLLNFARIYRAQSVVSHATIQAADAMALESYLREAAHGGDLQSIGFWAGYLTGGSSMSAAQLAGLNSANVGQLAKEKLASAIADSTGAADTSLRKLGVKDGLSGVQFSVARIDAGSGDVVLGVRYTVELQFPLFGVRELTLGKAAKAKTFGNVHYAVSGARNDPNGG